MSRLLTAKLDARGRLTLPEELRRRKGWGAGTVFYLREEGEVVSLARAENPFDVLAREAIAAHDAGQTKSLRDYARECNIRIDSE